MCVCVFVCVCACLFDWLLVCWFVFVCAMVLYVVCTVVCGCSDFIIFVQRPSVSRNFGYGVLCAEGDTTAHFWILCLVSRGRHYRGILDLMVCVRRVSLPRNSGFVFLCRGCHYRGI